MDDARPQLPSLSGHTSSRVSGDRIGAPSAGPPGQVPLTPGPLSCTPSCTVALRKTLQCAAGVLRTTTTVPIRATSLPAPPPSFPPLLSLSPPPRKPTPCHSFLPTPPPSTHSTPPPSPAPFNDTPKKPGPGFCLSRAGPRRTSVGCSTRGNRDRDSTRGRDDGSLLRRPPPALSTPASGSRKGAGSRVRCLVRACSVFFPPVAPLGTPGQDAFDPRTAFALGPCCFGRQDSSTSAFSPDSLCRLRPPVPATLLLPAALSSIVSRRNRLVVVLLQNPPLTIQRQCRASGRLGPTPTPG